MTTVRNVALVAAVLGGVVVVAALIAGVTIGATAVAVGLDAHGLGWVAVLLGSLAGYGILRLAWSE